MGLRNWGLARASGRGRGQETGALTDQQFKEGPGELAGQAD